MSKTKYLLGITVLSTVIAALISPLRGGYISIGSLTGFYLSSIVGFFIFFSVMVFLQNKFAEKLAPFRILICMLLGQSVIDLPFRIIEFESTLVSLPDYIIHLFGCIMGVVYYKVERSVRIIVLILSFTLAYWTSITGYDFWIHRLNNGTFTGKLDTTPLYDLEFQNTEGNTLSLTNFKGKYIILDCWYTYCGYCYEAFPQVQTLNDKYINNQEVLIYSLHSRIKKDEETTSTGTDILQKEGYTFPSMSIDIEDPILKEMGVNFYPTVLIFDKEGKLIFRGNIEKAGKYLENVLNEETKKS